MKDKGINKRVVRINLKGFHGENLPSAVIADTVRGLSPEYKNGSILKGITKEEEDELLPRIIGITKDDPRYYEKVDEFWNNLSVPVKYSEGLTLDCSTNEGKPINPKDYIIYKRAEQSSKVAKSEAESRTSNAYWFFIYDEEASKLNSNKNVKAVTRATQLFTEHEEDENTLDMLTWMFGEDPNRMDKAEKQNSLFEKVQTNPDLYIQFASDKDLGVKSEIYAMMHNNIIRKIGTTFLSGDYTMGDSIEEAVIFLRDPKNSALVNNMKAQLKQAKKNK